MEKNNIFLVRKLKLKPWSQEEDKLLLELNGNISKRNKWKYLSTVLNRRSDDCKKRLRQINPLVKKGHWQKAEDDTLINLIQIHGKNWSLISKFLKNRSGKQIRQRFLNCLDPSINKQKFSLQEDLKIIELYKTYKSDWKKYLEFFPGRTADIIKCRYYSSLRTKELKAYTKTQISKINPATVNNINTNSATAANMSYSSIDHDMNINDDEISSNIITTNINNSNSLIENNHNNIFKNIYHKNIILNNKKINSLNVLNVKRKYQKNIKLRHNSLKKEKSHLIHKSSFSNQSNNIGDSLTALGNNPIDIQIVEHQQEQQQ